MKSRHIHIALIVAGIALGFWHWSLVPGALMAASPNELLLAALVMVIGPCLTLPLVVFGAAAPKRAGNALMGVAISSLLVGTAVFLYDSQINDKTIAIFQHIVYISGPMMALGVGLRRVKPLTVNCESDHPPTAGFHQ